MPLFCDVALPVPLDQVFTYSTGPLYPVQGGRVLVPFGGQRLVGVVVRLHDEPLQAGIDAKEVQAVLDEKALLPDELMRLATWIAQYYVAPLGEVLRGMLPLTAELKRHFTYRIADAGRRVLYEGANRGASRRSRLTAEEQNREYAVLNYLEDGFVSKAAPLRSATGAGRALLEGMVRKKWLLREAMAEERDARRIDRMAVLAVREQIAAREDPGTRLPKLNQNQLSAMAELAAVGGRMRLCDLRLALGRLGLPVSTLSTLVKRKLVALEEAPAAFDFGSLRLAEKRYAHQPCLNKPQMEALATIVAASLKERFAPHLLFGVTGSGKTAVYVAAMQRVLQAGRSAILLVPEIGLTPAMTGHMISAFGGEVALLHSGLTPDERAEQWHRIRRGEARVIVGTRSAVFAPAVRLGLVIVDEEHDSSYKQEETPRYHGRDVAVMRAKLNNAVVLLGSATPSLESWANTERGRYVRVEMLTRVMDRPLPAVELIDMRAEFEAVGKEQVFARRLIEETQATLDRGEQAMILLNRRGYSCAVMCRGCGEKIQCENCAISMTFHKPVESSDGCPHSGQRLECHYCGSRRTVPQLCPKCKSEHLYFLGAGSQQGEEKLQEIFPQARLGRMDRNTIRGRSDVERMLNRLHSGEINLLVGTQMIAKGHDIHGVTLVGVVGADFALGLPDFRAAERVFQLLTQVSGRAGRGDLQGRVVVQTYHPDHYAVQCAASHDYPSFVAKEMNFRRWMHYPPHSVLANIIVQSERLEEASGWAVALGRWFAGRTMEKVRVLGPAAAPLVRLKRIYRYHLVLKAESRSVLGETLHSMLEHAETLGIGRQHLIIDVDAVHLM